MYAINEDLETSIGQPERLIYQPISVPLFAKAIPPSQRSTMAGGVLILPVLTVLYRRVGF